MLIVWNRKYSKNKLSIAKKEVSFFPVWFIKTPKTILYPIKLKELEIKDTTDTVKSASYLEKHLEIDHEGRLINKTLRQNR